MFLLLLCLVSTTGLWALGNERVTVNIEEGTLKSLFSAIEKQTTYVFSYRDDILSDIKPVTVRMKDSRVSSVLDKALRGTGLDYRIISSRSIVISRKNEAVSTAAATTSVRGYVYGADGEPIVGGSVLVKGNRNGVVTGIDGSYALADVPHDAVIVFSYIGCDPREIKADDTAALAKVVLSDNNQLLDEVVVVGYGTQKKVNTTGAITTVDFDKTVNGRPLMNATTALAGAAAGVRIYEGTAKPGDESVVIRVRGNNTFNSGAPLVLIDGMEGSIAQINPNDIASISILKDAASCAIYGARANNGVVLVTTKKGEGKPRFSYSYSGTWQKAHNKLAFVSDYARYMELSNEAKDNVGQAHLFSDATIQEWRDAALDPTGLNEAGIANYITHPNTDWFDEIFNTGYAQTHNVSVSGSTKTVSYLISASYVDNPGVMTRFDIDSGTEKVNVRANLEARPLSWLTIGTRMQGQRQTKGVANIDRAFEYLYQTTPGVIVGEPGKWGRTATEEESSTANNIFNMIYGADGTNRSYRGSANFYGLATLFKGFTVEANYTYWANFFYGESWSRRNINWDYIHDVKYSDSNLANASSSNNTNRTTRYNLDILARYNTTLAKRHEIGVLLGYNVTSTSYKSFNASRQGASDWGMTDYTTYETITGAGGNTPYKYGLRSYFGRVNYVFDGKYLFEANLRADGSSRFGPKRRWGYFPSFSAGWRISEEAFMNDYRALISNLKIRASWGKSGNNAIGNYDWQSTYSLGNVVIDGQGTKGFLKNVIGNEELHWEKTATTDIGLDFGLWNNHLTGEIDYYFKRTSDILFTPPMYLTMGKVSTAKQNLGVVKTSGIDVNLTWNSTIGKDFSYHVGINFGYSTNKVTSFKGEYQAGWTYDADGKPLKYVTNLSDVSATGFGGRICEGHTIGEIYSRLTYRGTGAGYSGEGPVDVNAGPRDGIIRTEQDMEWVRAMIAEGNSFGGMKTIARGQLWYGDQLYQDISGDKNYGGSDDGAWTGRVTTPSVILGINLGAEFKNFDISMVWSGEFGHYYTWNSTQYNRGVVGYGIAIPQRVADDHYFYDPDAPEDPRTNLWGTYPRLTFAGVTSGNYHESDRYQYKGDYMKLKNLTVGYTVPTSLTRRFFVSKLRAFVSMDNLLTLTSFPGLDPEMGTSVKYPLMRQFSLGAQVTF